MKKTKNKIKKISLKSYVERSNGIASKIVEGKMLAFFLDERPFVSEDIYILNETATKIWRFLAKRLTIIDIIKKISNEFNINYSRARKDVTNFILLSVQKGLINVYDNRRKLFHKREKPYNRCKFNLRKRS